LHRMLSVTINNSSSLFEFFTNNSIPLSNCKTLLKMCSSCQPPPRAHHHQAQTARDQERN
jgi:hypothetical protein